MVNNDNEMPLLRLFVSAALPDECKNYLHGIQNKLIQQQCMHAVFIPPIHMHTTLSFLGAVKKECLPAIQQALHKLTFPAFQVEYGRLELWPSYNERCLIVMTLHSLLLAELAGKVQHILQDFVRVAMQPFRAHATLARIQEINEPALLNSFIEQYAGNTTPSFKVDAFVLQQSILEQERPMYEIIDRFSLTKK